MWKRTSRMLPKICLNKRYEIRFKEDQYLCQEDVAKIGRRCRKMIRDTVSEIYLTATANQNIWFAGKFFKE